MMVRTIFVANTCPTYLCIVYAENSFLLSEVVYMAKTMCVMRLPRVTTRVNLRETATAQMLELSPLSLSASSL